MLKNVDGLFLCRPYIRIWELVVCRSELLFFTATMYIEYGSDKGPNGPFIC